MLNTEKGIINSANLTSDTLGKNDSNNNVYQPIILVLLIASCSFACSRLFSCTRNRNSSPQPTPQNHENTHESVAQLVFLEGEQNINY